MQQKKTQEPEVQAQLPTPEKSVESAAVTPPPAAPVTERINEQLPPKLVEAVNATGVYDLAAKPSSILAMRSYPEQRLWRVVFFDGQRHEFSFEGKWLTKPAPKAPAKPAKA